MRVGDEAQGSATELVERWPDKSGSTCTGETWRDLPVPPRLREAAGSQRTDKEDSAIRRAWPRIPPPRIQPKKSTFQAVRANAPTGPPAAAPSRRLARSPGLVSRQ